MLALEADVALKIWRADVRVSDRNILALGARELRRIRQIFDEFLVLGHRDVVRGEPRGLVMPPGTSVDFC